MANHSDVPSNEVLFDRMERFSEQLEAHREESRASGAEVSRKLDTLLSMSTRLENVEKRTNDHSVTLYGQADAPGIKGRVDRSERTLAAMVWTIGIIATAVVGLLFDWLKKKVGA